MVTPYSNIFTRFLRKIKDIDLGNKLIQNTDLAESQMIGYMDSAVENYVQCSTDLSDRDDTLKQFNQKLKTSDEEIIATRMVVEWVSPFVASIMSLQPFLTDQEFTTESNRLGIGNKLALQKEFENKTETLISKHSYADMDYTQFN